MDMAAEMRDGLSMFTRLITSDTRIKYPRISHYCPISPINVTSSRVSSTLDTSLGKSCLVDGNPETCWTSQQACITSTILAHSYLRRLPGPSTIHSTDISVPGHPDTHFVNLSRRFRWYYLRSGHPISRCHQLARTHTDLS